VFVKYWGTRGSIPTPPVGPASMAATLPAWKVRFDDTIFVCDAGSGIRGVGQDLLTRQPAPKELHLLLTHSHWDHIQAFRSSPRFISRA